MERIDLGWTVWSTTHSHGGLDPLTGAWLEPFGGVVVEVRLPEPSERDWDDDPAPPTFLCLNPDVSPMLEFRPVEASDVDRGAMPPQPPDVTTISRLIRRIGGILGYDGTRHNLKPRRGDLNDHEINLVTYMGRLVAVVGSTRPPRRFARRIERETPPPAPGHCFVD